jgi:aerobic-type carbon monoxide dehydrogenase small subunit (CoxS/CutS family)
MKNETSLTVNGMTYPVAIDSHATLLRAVRDDIGLTGTKEGCDDSECGACMMLIDGKPVNSWRAVRLLHAGHADLGHRIARYQPARD